MLMIYCWLCTSSLRQVLENLLDSCVVDIGESGHHLLGKNLGAALQKLPGAHLLVGLQSCDHLSLPNLWCKENHLDLPFGLQRSNKTHSPQFVPFCIPEQ